MKPKSESNKDVKKNLDKLFNTKKPKTEKVKIKGWITKDFYTDNVNIFIGKSPEIDKFWNWTGHVLMESIQLDDEFNSIKLKKGQCKEVEITVKIKNKQLEFDDIDICRKQSYI